MVRGLRVRRLQCDEIWAFVGAKQKNASPEKKAEGWGDAWTWTASDADTKLCVTFFFAEAHGTDAARTQREYALIQEFKPVGNTLLK